MKTVFKTYAETRDRKHIFGETFFLCHDCGETKPTPPAPGNLGTGYAGCGGDIVCYMCADERARKDLLTESRTVHYLSSDGQRLQTWSGGDLGRARMGARHVFSSERHHVSVTDCHGQRWHGVGGKGMWCTLRKCKASLPA